MSHLPSSCQQAPLYRRCHSRAPGWRAAEGTSASWPGCSKGYCPRPAPAASAHKSVITQFRQPFHNLNFFWRRSVFNVCIFLSVNQDKRECSHRGSVSIRHERKGCLASDHGAATIQRSPGPVQVTVFHDQHTLKMSAAFRRSCIIPGMC